ncbi:hypothetical protein GCM10011490_15000 [Pseudoclavibacter endophyticus]|uniref:Glycosyltransferase n=1 Tax=Pseudoclavibacter endophyticus TaxID=1778590 RepID=A0A6H9WN31_9MICO|nr:rhamnan synthesis F family protein [Pseudoclavibacter endophyticus]KAB1649111.1 glycosyltransferase [Pseudoclavibacter endophyticus]GGA65323.1 hypothetical protein GCM10011490_15000 [Pseudoclavibacter endophyticus]
MSARVSIVTRTKDRPLLLERAFRSVLGQTFSDYEMIIVNDAGDPAPVEALIAQFAEEASGRVRLVSNETSAGREAAMNTGFDAAAGEFLVLHDDDDSWAPDFLERTIGHLDEHLEDGGVAVRTEVVFERIEDGRVIEEAREILAEDLHAVRLADTIRRSTVPPISFVFRRSVFEAVGPIRGDLPVLADWEFLLRVLSATTVGFIDGEPRAFWHQRKSSTGDEGNSVIVDAGDHRDYMGRIRDEYLRKSVASGNDLGQLLFISGLFDEVERNAAGSGRLTAELIRAGQLAQSEHLQGVHAELQQEIARIDERQKRIEATQQRMNELLDYSRPVIGGLRKLMAPGLAARRGARRLLGRRTESTAPAAASDSTTTPGGPTEAASAPAPATRRRHREDTRVSDRVTKRIAFYLFFDADGQVDDYVVYKLEQLRQHTSHIFVVSNGPLTPAGRQRLEGVADTVWERQNVGFDVWGYKEAQEQFGWDRLGEYDELILLNYTFFGPIFPFAEVFDRMDAEDVDFWGLTEHAEVDPHPHHGSGVMPRHIQSHWIAVRRQMFSSEEYRAYWRDMPMISSYDESVDRHEARFLAHFEQAGFVSRVAFPLEDYPSDHPIFDDIVLMLRDRLPIVKRRLFFHDPLYLDRYAIIARDAMSEIERSPYPSDLIWRNVTRAAKPRTLATNLSLTEVLPEQTFPDGHPGALDRSSLPNIAVVCHLYYDDLVGEILDSVGTIPGPVDLFITTSDDAKRARIEAAINASTFIGGSDVRVVESNRGRDISAFIVGCGDVLRDEKYELIVKIHGKKSAQDGYNIGTWFKRHLIDNLLASPGYTENLVALFQRHATLGMAFPPTIHTGYPTMGHAWFANKAPAKKFAERLGITVPFDDSTPLSSYGSMFVARREAIASLTDLGLTWEDFPAEGGYKDGTLAHVIERMFSYVALANGFHVRTVMSPELAGINYSFLEYKYQAVSAFLPGYGIDQVAYLESAHGGVSSPVGLAKRLVEGKPAIANAIRPAYRAARSVYRRARGR